MTIRIYERYKTELKYILLFCLHILLAGFVILVIQRLPTFTLVITVPSFTLLIIFYIIDTIPTRLNELGMIKLIPKKYLVDWLASKDIKVRFYKIITWSSKIWTVWASILILFLIFILLKLLNLLILGVMALLNLNQNIVPEIQTPQVIIFSWLVIFLGVVMLWVFFGFYLVFPLNKFSIFPDTSDIPISFIHKSIDELNSFEFDAEWEKRQKSKNEISNLINNALEFISIEDKMWAVPHGLRYHNIIMGGIDNKSLRMDLLNRVNGLSIKLNEIIIDLNCMDNIEKREQIILDLKKYLKIIEDKEICAIEAVKFDETDNIFGPFRNIIKPLLHAMKIFK